jgi:hypothetical protein
VCELLMAAFEHVNGLVIAVYEDLLLLIAAMHF